MPVVKKHSINVPVDLDLNVPVDLDLNAPDDCIWVLDLAFKKFSCS